MSLTSEWLSGTVGLPFYFGTRRLKVSQARLKEAFKIEKLIEQRAQAWVKKARPAQPPKAKYTLDDYDNVVAALDNPLQANPDITQLPEEFQVDFIAKYLDIRAWLSQYQPAIKFSGGIIAREIPPPDSNKIKFMWAVNVLDDLGRVFDLLDAGCLAPSEAMALREVYPEFIMGVMVAYLNATVDYIYENEFFSLSGWKMAGLSALAGVPITSFQDVMSWQMNYDQEGPGRPQGSKAPNLAQNNVSDMQALGAPV
jgi:hypothetical protein